VRPARLTAFVALVALVAVVGAGCRASGGKPDVAGVVKVVAAENFWGDIARQIGGAHVDVTSIISDPSADPHQYESDARTAAQVADAQLVVVNGLGYDDFVDKLLSNTSHKGRVVLSVADTLGVKGHDANPHLWYDLPRIPQVARAVEAALVTADPADRATFAANRKTFVASLAPLDLLVRRIRAEHAGAPVAYTERVAGYLLDAAGLTVASPSGFAEAIEAGNEPSARDSQAMNDLITQHRIDALIYNAQATSPATSHVQDLAHDNGVPVVAVTETMPKDEPTYQAWQQHQLEALVRALGS
jgi:zinc/manganese transport system substrate-binding protein